MPAPMAHADAQAYDDGSGVTVQSGPLRHAINTVRTAVQRSKFVQIACIGGTFTVSASDDARVAVIAVPVQTSSRDFTAMISSRDREKVIASSLGITTSITANQEEVIFRSGAAIHTAPWISATPHRLGVIDSALVDATAKASIPKKDLLLAVRQSRPLTPYEANACHLQFSSGCAVLSAGHPRTGFSQMALDVGYVGRAFGMYLDLRHVRQAAMAESGDRVEIWLEPTGRRPGVVMTTSGCRILLPVCTSPPVGFTSAMEMMI
ncbi:hypothetical protein [Rubripirellula lacrimiformis]|nr:hypothetical protein [Rubripirellula lacrimiformis]